MWLFVDAFEFFEEFRVHAIEEGDGDMLFGIIDGSDEAREAAFTGVDAMRFELMRRGQSAAFVIEPEVCDSSGAVERRPREVEEHELAGLECRERFEALCFENACAGEEVEGEAF